MRGEIEALIATRLADFDPEVLEPFASELKRILGGRASAVTAYGSSLSDVTRSATSTPDFYVVVERYAAFHASFTHACLNRILPPNIYHFDVGGRTSKYNVLSFEDLQRGTSASAPDVYQMGRFSKRMALVSSRDEASKMRIVDIQTEAMRSAARKAWPLIPGTPTVETLARAALRISYDGDIRVEAQDKVDRIWQADESFYRRAFGAIFEELRAAPPSGRLVRLGSRWFLWKSRLRAQLRWPKGIWTVENWLDYLIRKIDRTQGIRIEMTPRERRFWFIYGWKYFFALRRRNLIK